MLSRRTLTIIVVLAVIGGICRFVIPYGIHYLAVKRMRVAAGKGVVLKLRTYRPTYAPAWLGEDVFDGFTAMDSIAIYSDRHPQHLYRELTHFPEVQAFLLSAPKETPVPIFPRLSRLESVTLRDVGITNQTLQTVTHSRSLATLSLERTSITDQGLRLLAACPQLTTLTTDRNGFSDAALEEIGSLKSLQLIRLQNEAITDAGIRHLSDLPQLVQLELIDCPVTEAVEREVASWKRKVHLTVHGGLAKREAAPVP